MEALEGTAGGTAQYMDPCVPAQPGSARRTMNHRVTSMERARYVSHKGRRILYVDYSGIRTLEELESAAREATILMQAEPPNSVLALLDLTGVPFGLRIVRMLGEAAAANMDFVTARAIVGLPDAARPTLGAVADFSGRPLQAFESAEAALEWLAERQRGC